MIKSKRILIISLFSLVLLSCSNKNVANNINTGTNDEPIDESFEYSSISFCGDSYTAALFFDDDKYTMLGEIPEKSWPTIFGQKTNRETKIFAQSGVDTEYYLTSKICLPKILNSDDTDLYFIALGINDYWKNKELGSKEDLNNDECTTVYANLGKLVKTLKNEKPNSKIILSKCLRPFDVPMYDFYSKAIEDISEFYGVAYAETNNNPYINSNEFESGMNCAHPSLKQQDELAEAINDIIETTIKDNYNYFKQ